MMIAFVTFNSSLTTLIEDLCSSNPCEFKFSGFRQNRTDDRARGKRRENVCGEFWGDFATFKKNRVEPAQPDF